MTLLHTWAHRSAFTYEGSVRAGTRIEYGEGALSLNGVPHSVEVVSLHYLGLLLHFAGQTVPVGTSRTDPPAGSLGDWLKAVITETAIASYVAPILIHERYAQRVGDHDIRIRTAAELPPGVVMP